jgi:hypothetical protein
MLEESYDAYAKRVCIFPRCTFALREFDTFNNMCHRHVLPESQFQNTELHLHQPQHHMTVLAELIMSKQRINNIQKLIRAKKYSVGLDMVNLVFRRVVLGTTLPLHR